MTEPKTVLALLPLPRPYWLQALLPLPFSPRLLYGIGSCQIPARLRDPPPRSRPPRSPYTCPHPL